MFVPVLNRKNCVKGSVATEQLSVGKTAILGKSFRVNFMLATSN